MNWWVWDEFPWGRSAEEFAVASLLWDLYDGRESRDSDNIDLTLDSLWSVLGHTTNQNDLTDMRDVYEALTQASLANEDGTPVANADIDQVFVVHGFYADDGDFRHEPAEDAGWGGRPDRCSMFEIPNAYFRVDVQDEEGHPVAGAVAEVNIRFEDSYYDFSYTVDLAQASGNLIGLGFPPERIPATAELTVAHAGGLSESYTINNRIFWDKVADSDTGYAEQHTFVVQAQPLFLPLILRNLG